MDVQTALTYLKLAAPILDYVVENEERYEWSDGTYRLLLDGNTVRHDVPATLELVGGLVLDQGTYAELCKTYDLTIRPEFQSPNRLSPKMSIIRAYIDRPRTP